MTFVSHKLRRVNNGCRGHELWWLNPNYDTLRVVILHPALSGETCTGLGLLSARPWAQATLCGPCQHCHANLSVWYHSVYQDHSTSSRQPHERCGWDCAALRSALWHLVGIDPGPSAGTVSCSPWLDRASPGNDIAVDAVLLKSRYSVIAAHLRPSRCKCGHAAEGSSEGL